MEGILSEFAKVEKAAPGLIASNRNGNVTFTESTISSNPNPIKSTTSKSKSKSKSTITIPDAIDDLIQTLETAKHSLQSTSSTSTSSTSYPINPSILLAEISSSISQTQKSISERQKEFNSALSKLSKALEKKFPIQVSNISDPNLFNGKEPQRALEAVVMEHLIRENKWETAQKFAKEANLPFSPPSLSVFSVLHNTSQALSLGNLRPAIEWARKERKFLESRGSGLEFALHRSMFVRIALGIDGREQGNPIQATSEEVRKVSTKGKGKEREESSILILNDDHQAELQEVESQVLGNGGISDPDGERFEQNGNGNGNSSDGSNSSSSSSYHQHHSNGNTLNIQSNVEKALNYGRKHFQPFLKSHLNEIQKLFTFLLFLPSASLGNGMENGNGNGVPMQLDESIMSFQTAKNDFDLDAELDLDLEVKLDLNDPNNHFGNPSLNYNHHHHPSHLEEEAMEIDQRKDGEGEDLLPIPSPLHLSLLSILPEPYRPLLHPNLTHAPFLLPMFKIEFCSRVGVAKEPPLRIGVEVGAGGALNRIWKVRNMMMKSGNEWSQGDELPVEIPLPPHLRFHSTFACPVSKEQGTEENPPMMMACGHVICLESLNKLGRREGRLKCPYCPTESSVSQAIRVYF